MYRTTIVTQIPQKTVSDTVLTEVKVSQYCLLVRYRNRSLVIFAKLLKPTDAIKRVNVYVIAQAVYEVKTTFARPSWFYHLIERAA